MVRLSPVDTFMPVNLEELRTYCLKKGPKITEGFPFGENVLVFKSGGKMFALVRLDLHPVHINLKCDPEKALGLRERYASVQPGYHMNKKLWNTVVLDGTIPAAEIRRMIDHSFDEVARMTARKR